MYQYILIPSHINIVIEEYLMTWENIYNTFDVPNSGCKLNEPVVAITVAEGVTGILIRSDTQ